MGKSLGALLLLSVVCGCKKPAGTVLVDWTYEVDDASGRTAPSSFNPPKMVTSKAEWPTAKGPVELRFETEIGDYTGTDGVRWNWPRHIRITLAEPAAVKLPMVDCMPGPPGNKIDKGMLVHPVGKDGVTPTGLVVCFVSTSEGTPYAFEVNGDGQVTRSVPKH